MFEPLGQPHLSPLISRSRVRVFLGHLCTEWPQNPSAASHGCTQGKASEKEGLETSRGHLGEHSQATARQQRCCCSSPSSSKYASPSAHSVRVHILSPPLCHSRRESARARRSVRPVKCVEALPPAAEVTFVGFGAKKSRQNKNFKSIVLNNKNTCTSRTKAQYHQT